MPRVEHADAAEADLVNILTYVGRQDREAADRLYDRIVEKCELLSEFPHLGTACDEIRKGLRYFALGMYVIFYYPIADGIQVVRITRGGRDYQAMFNE